MNGDGFIDEKMWDEMTEEMRNTLIFRSYVEHHQRIKALEGRKRWDTTVAGLTGFFGGIVAHIGQWILTGSQPK